MSLEGDEFPTVQRWRRRSQRAGFLLQLLIVLLIGIFSYANVDQGFREYRRLAKETLPVIEALEGQKFWAMRAVASIGEFGLIRRLVADADAGAATHAALEKERGEAEEGLERFNLELTRYHELTLHYFPQEVPTAERLYHEGGLLRRNAVQLLAALGGETSPSRLLALKAEMEQREERFLQLAEEILAHEAEEVAERDQLISAAAEAQLWVLGLGGLVLIGVSAGLRRLELKLCRRCPGGLAGHGDGADGAPPSESPKGST